MLNAKDFTDEDLEHKILEAAHTEDATDRKFSDFTSDLSHTIRKLTSENNREKYEEIFNKEKENLQKSEEKQKAVAEAENQTLIKNTYVTHKKESNYDVSENVDSNSDTNTKTSTVQPGGYMDKIHKKYKPPTQISVEISNDTNSEAESTKKHNLNAMR